MRRLILTLAAMLLFVATPLYTQQQLNGTERVYIGISAGDLPGVGYQYRLLIDGQRFDMGVCQHTAQGDAQHCDYDLPALFFKPGKHTLAAIGVIGTVEATPTHAVAPDGSIMSFSGVGTVPTPPPTTPPTGSVVVHDPPPPALLMAVPSGQSVVSPDGKPTVATFTALLSGGTPPYTGPTCLPASGALFPVGATSVTCTASDASNQQATGTFSVTVTYVAQPPPPPPPAWWTTVGKPCVGGFARTLLPVSDTDWWAGCNTTGVQHSTDGGATWTAANTGLPSLSVQGLTNSPFGIYVSLGGTAGVFKLNGTTWSIVSSIPHAISAATVLWHASSNELLVYANNGNMAIYASPDGTSFTLRKQVHTGLGLKFAELSGNRLWVEAESSGPWLSTDHGETWIAPAIKTGAAIGPVNGFSIGEAPNGQAIVAERVSVYRWPGTGNWLVTNGLYYADTVRGFARSATRVYAATYNVKDAVYSSADSGATWQPFGKDSSQVPMGSAQSPTSIQIDSQDRLVITIADGSIRRTSVAVP